MNLPAGLVRILGVLANRNYAIWIGGNSVSLTAMWAQRIGIGWLAWELTQSVFWVGIIAAADLAPGLLVTPFAGIVGDRRDRLTLVRQAQGLSAVISAALAAMVLLDAADIYLLVALATAQGIAMGFKQPSRMALVRSLVVDKDLSTAIALNAVLFNLARFVGPLVAGGLILSQGLGSVFVFALLGSIFFVVTLKFVRPLRREPAPASSSSPADAPLKGTAYAYAFSHPGIGPLLVLQFANGAFIRGFTELLPAYSDTVLGRGAEGLAIMSASIGVGAIFSGLWLAQREGVKGLTRHIFVSQAIASVLVVVLAGTATLLMASLLVGLIGFMLATTSIAALTLIQRATPEDRLARVMAILGVILHASPAAGALVMGAAADLVGFTIPLIAGGALCLAAVAYVLRREGVVRASLEAADVKGS
ncbi:hypothetical protein MNBD_ALPHA09-2083 [hydrothermal vent metagenome]|uniref:Major facilitator superfamily (MFS) profile domain-containing protein n=1 Tax=hydrothermal vent metagenome TaxID=652676 RepID=A0A3B0TB53_9ZZZZ